MRLRGANEEGSGTGNEDLKLYATLSRAPFPKSYLGKVFLAAFLSTHEPLLSLVVYLARDPRRIGSRATVRILSVALLATLGGTVATLWAMSALSAPVTLASRALRRYLDRGEIPALPVGYPDRAGRLMSDVQYAVERLDAALRSLEELATTDHVTGVYNRRAAEERLAEDIARAQREGGTLTLAALDLDDFKPINDEHGHRAWDACIKHFADFLGCNLRQGDWVGRRRIRGGSVARGGRSAASGAGLGAGGRRGAREPGGATERQRGVSDLQWGGGPVEAGGGRPESVLQGGRSPLPGQGRGRELRRTRRLAVDE